MLTDREVTFDTDAVALLTADHKKIQKAFKDFKRLKKRGSKRYKLEIVRQACIDLKIHALIEIELFYPAVSKAITITDENKALIDEAGIEHVEAGNLITQLETMQPGDALFDAKFSILGNNINHHIEKEESVMFPMVRKSKLDLVALGDHMTLRQTQLQSELSLSARKTQAQNRITSTPETNVSELRDV